MRVLRPLLLCAAAAIVSAPALAQRGPAASAPADPALASPQSERILAVVNGDPITTGDVAARARLFALTSGLPVTQDVIDRLRPQILRLLIDERLRLQEEQRRKIVVNDNEIADAIGQIEQRNNMPKGALAAALRGKGVALRTLIDQVRVQIGWTRLLREELGGRTEVSDAEVADQARLYKAQVGQPEYHLGEIFIPIDDPTKSAEAERFADTVIGELRKGAPFPVIAAQFSQNQTALQGGDIGWVRANQLDPLIADVVREMPPGAVSNPVRVPGGIEIVTLVAKRIVGQDQTTVLDVHQAFLPFATPLDPNAPTEQQRKTVEQIAALSKSAKSCDDIAAANDRFGKVHPTDPGEVHLETLGSAPLRALLTTLPVGQASRPLVSSDGAAVLMICSRDVKAVTEPSKKEIAARLFNERVELTSRQLLRDLRRRAILDMRVDNASLP